MHPTQPYPPAPSGTVPPVYYGPPQRPVQTPYGPQPTNQRGGSPQMIYVVGPPQQVPGYSAPIIYMQPPPAGQRGWIMKNDSVGFVNSGFEDHNIRRNFVKKVYLLLFSQLCLTGALITVCVIQPEICRWIRRNPVFTYLAYAVFLFTYITLACCGNLRRSYPWNLIALFIFTLAMSYFAATVSCAYSTVSILVTVAVTGISCLAISLLAICGCIDFTKCMNLLLVFTISLLLFGIACFAIYMISGPNRILHAVYGGLAAVLFMLYLAFDTQMIIGGRTYEISPEEYVFATIQLYLDIMYLFIILLGLFGERE